MNELAELELQHQRNHGPCGCLQPANCASARYLAVIERLAGECDELLRWKQQREIDDYEELVEAAKQRRARQ